MQSHPLKRHATQKVGHEAQQTPRWCSPANHSALSRPRPGFESRARHDKNHGKEKLQDLDRLITYSDGCRARHDKNHGKEKLQDLDRLITQSDGCRARHDKNHGKEKLQDLDRLITYSDGCRARHDKLIAQ